MRCLNCKFRGYADYEGIKDFFSICKLTKNVIEYDEEVLNCTLTDDDYNMSSEGKRLLIERNL